MKSKMYYNEKIESNGKKYIFAEQVTRKQHLLSMAQKNGWKKEWLEHLPTKVLTTFAGKDIRELRKSQELIKKNKQSPTGQIVVTVANLLKKYTPIFKRR